MHDRAGGQEQQCLGEILRQHVEQRCQRAAHAEASYHLIELRDGRVSQHLLDTVLADGEDLAKDERAD